MFKIPIFHLSASQREAIFFAVLDNALNIQKNGVGGISVLQGIQHRKAPHFGKDQAEHRLEICDVF